MSGFVKLYGTILDSSIWGEPLSVRIVWISLLAMADKDGRVAASSDGISRRANVPLKQTDHALAVLSSPDARSKSDEHEGRRVERIDGGYQILNYAKYRELRTDKQIADAERIREKRERGVYDSRGPLHVGYDATRSPEADGEAKANTETDKEPLHHPAFAFNEIATVLGLKTRQLVPWNAMLHGMTEGLGTPNMKPVPWPILHEAAVELSTQEGEFTANRFKVFVRKVLERQARTTAPRSSNGDKVTRGKAALNEWLNETEIPEAEVVDG